jgi:hypothetical protein
VDEKSEDVGAFERSVSRRELLKKVAIYAPPAVIAGRALISTGVAMADDAQSSVSTSGSTSIGRCNSVSSVAGGCSDPFSALVDDLDTLLGVTATGVRSVDKKIAEAVGDLTEATQDYQWSDDFTLVSSSGDNVYFDLIWAADALNTSGSSDSDVADVLADVVTQAGVIANIAVGDAGLTGKAAKKAARKLAKGSQRAASGNVRGAIAAYMHAWDVAVTGVEASTPDDSDSDD